MINKVFFILVWGFFLSMVSCGKKEEMKECASKVRKEFKSGNVHATLEEGCIVKYAGVDEYKADGNITLQVNNSGKEVKIFLTKGATLITTESECIIKSELKAMKIRLISGTATVEYKDKIVPLETNKVLTIGG